MVGHTHEDIDQTFSCLARYLRKHDAFTMPGKLWSVVYYNNNYNFIEFIKEFNIVCASLF